MRNMFFRKIPKTKPEIKTYGIVSRVGETGIKCFDCGRTSWNENDVNHKYCGYCNEFHEMKELRAKYRLDETFDEFMKRDFFIMWLIYKIAPFIFVAGVISYFADPLLRATTGEWYYIWKIPASMMVGAGIGNTLIKWFEVRQKDKETKKKRKEQEANRKQYKEEYEKEELTQVYRKN